jgi:hypothetical protein
MNHLPALRLFLAAAAISSAAAPASRGEVIGNWDFSTGSLSALSGEVTLSELAATAYYVPFGGQSGIPRIQFNSPASFGISGPGGTAKTVLRVPNTAGFGPMGGLIAEFPRRVNATENSLNRYTIVMDVLVRKAAYDAVFDRGTKQYVSLFQTAPRSDGDLFIDVRRQDGAPPRLGIGGVYGGDVVADQWHRIAWVANLDASTSQPRFTAYLDGQPVSTLIWDALEAQAIADPSDSVKADLTDPLVPSGVLQADGRFSIATIGQISGGQLPDFNTSAFFLFNDNDNELGEVFVAHLQFRAEALSPTEILALGGVDGGPIAVPEPGTIGLAGAALALLVALGRYRPPSLRLARERCTSGSIS